MTGGGSVKTMRRFFSRHRGLHLWLLADLCALILFWLLRNCRPAMDVLSAAATKIRRAVGAVCYLVPFSVAEVLCVALAAGAAVFLVWNAAAVLRARGRRLGRLYRGALGAVCAVLTVYAGFCWLWGVQYYTASFQELSGIYAQPVSAADLEAVTRYFAQQLAQTADSEPRDEEGAFAVDRAEILAGSTRVYDALEQQFPFLAFDDPGIKPVALSRAMSALDFTGIYCPFTGESNVNMDAPACLLPSTAAHELAHQRGVASEQECNFLAILASTTSTQAAYVYSGWLLGYIHLGNALYKADPQAYADIAESLPQTVRRDLDDNNAYWRQFRDSTVQKVSNQVYDGFLKSYDQELGLQTYGTVVDLLVVYYRDAV